MTNVRSISLDKITVPEDRQRTSIPQQHVEDLADSIERIGLIHPIVLDNAADTLRAGECRFRAFQLLAERGVSVKFDQTEYPPGEVPYVRVYDTDEATLHEIELEENLRRENLSVVDRARAIARLHELRSSQREGNWTKGDTGAEVAARQGRTPTNYDTTQVSQSLLIAEHADDPDVRKAKDYKEADKIIRTKLNRDLYGVLGAIEREGGENHSTASATPASGEEGEGMPSNPGGMRVIHGDAIHELQGLTKGSFRGIVVDPPYGVGADTFGEQAYLGGHTYDDSDQLFWSILGAIAGTGRELLDDEGVLYLFCAIQRVPEIVTFLRERGWYPWHYPLIWDKCGVGHLPVPDKGPRHTYECIIYASKSETRPAVQRTGTDVLRFQGIREGRLHSAEKPQDLMKEILQRFARPGDKVLDPCAGSGSIIPPAMELGLDLTCIELDEDSVNLCYSRVNGGSNGS